MSPKRAPGYEPPKEYLTFMGDGEVMGKGPYWEAVARGWVKAFNEDLSTLLEQAKADESKFHESLWEKKP